MERIMLIMIVAVALVAIGGLLFVGVQQAPTPVFIEQPTMHAQQTPPGTVVGEAKGQIRFSVAKPSDTATGKIAFSVK